MSNDPRRIHPPTPAEVNAVARAMEDGLGPMVLFAAWSGVRMSESCKVQKRDVTDCGDFARVVVYRGKGRDGGKTRQALLLGPGWAAVRALAAWEFGAPDTHLFVRPSGKSSAEVWDRKAVWHRLNRARESVGLGHVIFHDFRKFYATQLLNSGVTDMDVAVALGHLDKNGQPRTELIRQVYGFVNHDKALDRVAEVANVSSTGEVDSAAAGRVAAGERDQDASGGVEAGDRRGGPQSARRVGGAVAGGRDDEGLGVAAVGAEGRAGEGEQDPAPDFRGALEDARRRVAASARGVAGRVEV